VARQTSIEDLFDELDQPVGCDSRIFLIRCRSLRFARRIALAMIGAAIFEKPVGSPRLRKVILVEPCGASSQV
jgi:hypothetical protein